MSILWAIIVGFLAGLIARWITPGAREIRGFILTTVLGVVGAVVATWLGQQIGVYGPGSTAGFVGAVIGSVIVLLGWGAVTRAVR